MNFIFSSKETSDICEGGMCFKCSPPQGVGVEHPMSRRFLDDAEDLVDSGRVCNLYPSTRDPLGCSNERSECEGGLCLRCCTLPLTPGDQGLSEGLLERVERLAEAGMVCGAIIGPEARSHAPLETPGVQTVCDGDKVCYVCRQ